MNWDYLSGFIDGEGSLSLVKGGAYKDRHGTYRPVLVVTNTNKTVLEEIKDFLGEGNVFLSRPARGKWRACYVYRLTGSRRLSVVLPHLRSRLIIKSRQAEILQRFCERRLTQGTRRFTSEDYSLVDEIRQANNQPKGTARRTYPTPTLGVA